LSSSSSSSSASFSSSDSVVSAAAPPPGDVEVYMYLLHGREFKGCIVERREERESHFFLHVYVPTRQRTCCRRVGVRPRV
jgi:hypothetical protein